MTPPCPECAGEMGKVIYFGLPIRLCKDESCNCIDGVFSVVAAWMPIATYDGYFAFMPYEGSYLSALRSWLFDSEVTP